MKLFKNHYSNSGFKPVLWNLILVTCISGAILVAIGIIEIPILDSKGKLDQSFTLSQGLAVEFRKGADGSSYLLEGWASAEERATWNSESRASLQLPAAAFTGKHKLVFRAVPFLYPPELMQQRIEISINSNKIFEDVVSEQQIKAFSVRLPRYFRNEDCVLLYFNFPDARSPRELGLSRDIRRLAFQLISMELSEG